MQVYVWQAADILTQRVREPGLAYAGLPRQKHYLTFPTNRSIPALGEQSHFVFASHEWCQSLFPSKVKTTCCSDLGSDLPDTDRAGCTPDISVTEILEVEPTFCKLKGSWSDNDTIDFSYRLQSRSDVRGFSDHRTFLGCALANQVADHHWAGRNADANAKVGAGLASVETRHGLNDTKTRVNCPLSIVLMRLGIAEVGTQSPCRGSGDSMYTGENARNTGSPIAWSVVTANRTPVRDRLGAMGWRRGP